MIRVVAGLALALAGCIEQPPQPQYPQTQEVSGPPGGGMDQPTYAQYEADSQPSESAAYSQPYADDGDQTAEPEPSADPQDPGYDMGPVNDAEIDSTLQPYGEWIEDPDYGRVWRPYATVVGADFTPYQSCGSWVWTDWGWSYACDWDWGWLPFHYGRWDWFDDGYWGWVPGYEWGPGWVDWRHGGGYVGWRPTAPEFHDHRTGGGNFHDHRHGMHDGQWSFVNDHDFGNGHIRPHLYKDLAQGLSVTTPVVKPNIRGVTQPVRVASTMRARMSNPVWRQNHAPVGGWRQPVTAHSPTAHTPTWQRPQQPQQVWRQPQQGWRQPPVQQQQWRQPQQTWRQPQQTWRQPQQRPQTWNVPPSQHPVYTRPTYTRPSYTPPTYTSRPTYTPPSRPAYTPPSRPTWTAPRPTYTAPTYSAPRPSYTPPTYSAPRPSYSPPSHSWSSPSYSAPSHSYSAPSHSSYGGGGGHSYGGGGGHRR
jgi:hypothetical protein